MAWFRNMSIQQKLRLIITGSTLFALSVVFTGITVYDIRHLRSDLRNELAVLAEIAGNRSRAALLFNDVQSARETLDALRANKNIIEATIYTPDGTLFSRSGTGQSVALRPHPEGTSSYIDNDCVHLFHTIVFDEQKIGTVYLRSTMHRIYQRLNRYVAFAATLTLAAMLLAMVLSRWLQQSIIDNIMGLATTARMVRRQKDYALRADKHSTDELGVLIDDFNDMLGEIQQRDSAVREREEQYKGLVSNIQGAVYRCSCGDVWTFEFMSEEIRQITGSPASEFVGRNVESYAARIHPEDRPAVEATVAEGARTCASYTIEYRVLHTEGTIRWVYEKGRGVATDTPGQPRLDGVILDITQRRHLEAALQENEALFRTQFELGNIGIAITSADATWARVNRKMCDMLGYSEATLKRMTWSDITHPDDAAMEAVKFEAMRAGEIDAYEMDKRFIRVDGSTIWTHFTASCFRNQDGTIRFTIASILDITERLKMQEQVKQTQKMEAIGTLAGGIAHDFNNILAAIIGYSELAQDSLPQQSTAQKHLAQILKSAMRARDLVRQILTFSRKGRDERKPLQLSTIVKEVAKLLRSTIPTTIDIRVSVSSDDSIVFADPIQMHQILMNLCTNAAHAMHPGGGALEIMLAPIDITRNTAAECRDVPPGAYVELSVSDTGMGIDPSILHRIYEPFFTTKEKEQGTGMGLAVVHGIIRDHGGHICVDSRPGRGTTFRVLLPRIAMPAAGDPADLAPLPTGSEHILYVDDEEPLTILGRQILESLGYRVTAVNNSLEALALLTRTPHEYDMLLTDHTMPSMTGFELSRQALAIRPDLPVILCTGYSDTVSPEQTRAAGISAFLYKPLSKKDLAETIRALLDAVQQ